MLKNKYRFNSQLSEYFDMVLNQVPDDTLSQVES